MKFLVSFELAAILLLSAFLPVSAEVRRIGGKTVIEGIGPLQTRDGRDSTLIGCLAELMSIVGEKDITYEWLMGVSGAAFRIQHMDWSPRALNDFVGFNSGLIALESLPYKIIRIKPADDRKAALEMVAKSIDKGVPVIGFSEEAGLVVGYADGGNTLIWRKYEDAGKEYSESNEMPAEFLVLGEKRQKPEKTKTIVNSLDLALGLAVKPKIGNYDFGFNAYNVWASQLENESSFSLLGERGLRSRATANALQYAALLNARKAAAVYLKSISSTFRRETRSELIKASEAYNDIYKTLKKGTEYMPYPPQSAGEMADKWTPEMRKKQAKTLRDAASDEKRALHLISRALESARTAMD